MQRILNARSSTHSQASHRARRQRLLAEAIRQHGIPGLTAYLDLLEVEFGEALGIDRRLEALIEADPAVIALNRRWR